MIETSKASPIPQYIFLHKTLIMQEVNEFGVSVEYERMFFSLLIITLEHHFKQSIFILASSKIEYKDQFVFRSIIEFPKEKLTWSMRRMLQKTHSTGVAAERPDSFDPAEVVVPEDRIGSARLEAGWRCSAESWGCLKMMKMKMKMKEGKCLSMKELRRIKLLHMNHRSSQVVNDEK